MSFTRYLTTTTTTTTTTREQRTAAVAAADADTPPPPPPFAPIGAAAARKHHHHHQQKQDRTSHQLDGADQQSPPPPISKQQRRRQRKSAEYPNDGSFKISNSKSCCLPVESGAERQQQQRPMRRVQQQVKKRCVDDDSDLLSAAREEISGDELDLGRRQSPDDDELSLPRSVINKLLKEAAGKIRVSADVRELIVHCCHEFVRVVSSLANSNCEKMSKKLIGPEHVLSAISDMGFKSFLPLCIEVMSKAQEEASRRRKRMCWRNERDSAKTDLLRREQQELFAKARQEQYASMHFAAVDTCCDVGSSFDSPGGASAAHCFIASGDSVEDEEASDVDQQEQCIGNCSIATTWD